jgi:hypothetical protein
MKKALTIILLSISLSGFSQTEKGDWVITPTVGWNTVQYRFIPERYESLWVKLPIEIHKYLSDRFAIGLVTNVEHSFNQPYVTSSFYRSQWVLGLFPQVRYNFLKSRFTPFIAGRILNIEYITTFNDNPAIAVDLRRISNLQLTEGLQIDVGVSYFIKDRFGLQVKLMDANVGFGNKTNFYTPINFGLQFIINNPRPEIESPR